MGGSAQVGEQTEVVARPHSVDWIGRHHAAIGYVEQRPVRAAADKM
jgi:hypothetical protein